MILAEALDATAARGFPVLSILVLLPAAGALAIALLPRPFVETSGDIAFVPIRDHPPQFQTAIAIPAIRLLSAAARAMLDLVPAPALKVQADLQALPLKPGKLAGAWANRSYQHIPRVELPLALPAMVAGLRIATVTVISLATIAAFVGISEGLGAPIFDAINRGDIFNTELVGGGALAILLAILAVSIWF